jgi:hypothetical protein
MMVSISLNANAAQVTNDVKSCDICRRIQKCRGLGAGSSSLAKEKEPERVPSVAVAKIYSPSARTEQSYVSSLRILREPLRGVDPNEL